VAPQIGLPAKFNRIRNPSMLLNPESLKQYPVKPHMMLAFVSDIKQSISYGLDQAEYADLFHYKEAYMDYLMQLIAWADYGRVPITELPWLGHSGNKDKDNMDSDDENTVKGCAYGYESLKQIKFYEQRLFRSTSRRAIQDVMFDLERLLEEIENFYKQKSIKITYPTLALTRIDSYCDLNIHHEVIEPLLPTGPVVNHYMHAQLPQEQGRSYDVYLLNNAINPIILGDNVVRDIYSEITFLPYVQAYYTNANTEYLRVIKTIMTIDLAIRTLIVASVTGKPKVLLNSWVNFDSNATQAVLNTIKQEYQHIIESLKQLDLFKD